MSCWCWYWWSSTYVPITKHIKCCSFTNTCNFHLLFAIVWCVCNNFVNACEKCCCKWCKWWWCCCCNAHAVLLLVDGFMVKKKTYIHRFSIVNLVKSDSLYNDGMRPLMYSTINAKQVRQGWRRCGENIAYYRNDDE